MLFEEPHHLLKTGIRETSSGSDFKTMSEPSKLASKRNATVGWYEEWAATCSKCDSTFDRNSVPCPICTRFTLIAFFAVHYDNRMDPYEPKKAEVSEFRCERCDITLDALQCANMRCGSLIRGKNLRVNAQYYGGMDYLKRSAVTLVVFLILMGFGIAFVARHHAQNPESVGVAAMVAGLVGCVALTAIHWVLQTFPVIKPGRKWLAHGDPVNIDRLWGDLGNGSQD